MKALTVGSYSTVDCGTPTAIAAPPNALPVASASARPIAVTRTSPAIPTGVAGTVSPTTTPSPIQAEAVGVARDVAWTAWIVIAPPEPDSSVVSARAPAISARTERLPALVILTASPTNARVVPIVFDSIVKALTVIAPPEPPTPPVFVNELEVALTSTGPLALIVVVVVLGVVAGPIYDSTVPSISVVEPPVFTVTTPAPPADIAPVARLVRSLVTLSVLTVRFAPAPTK